VPESTPHQVFNDPFAMFISQRCGDGDVVIGRMLHD
jgi:hypothetical protein